MSNRYTLILTGEVRPGFSPESVWPQLAADFRMAPEKLTELLARAPQIIKKSDDLGALQALQDGIAQSGAQAEICPPDERPALFVLIDNTPRGPVPRAWVEQCLARGVWAEEAIRVAETGSTTWVPYRELDTALSMSPLQPPAPPPSSGGMTAATPAGYAAPGFAVRGSDLPAGDAIHAGFWRRLAALTLDGLVILIPLLILSIVPILGTLFVIIGQWLYFALMESSGWQATVGKRIMGIKVVDQQGRRIGFGRATGRYFGKMISGLILDIGFMMAGWTRRKQALHDKMAGACVVFDAVQPGQPLPAQRPPMPWYGWALSCVVPALFISGVLAAMALPAYQDYLIRSQVKQAIDATEAIRAEIADQGCQSGNYVSPHPWIGSATVDGDEPGSCAITLRLGRADDIPQHVRDKTITLARDDDGNWVCSSLLPAKSLPEYCR